MNQERFLSQRFVFMTGKGECNRWSLGIIKLGKACSVMENSFTAPFSREKPPLAAGRLLLTFCDATAAHIHRCRRKLQSVVKKEREAGNDLHSTRAYNREHNFAVLKQLPSSLTALPCALLLPRVLRCTSAPWHGAGTGLAGFVPKPHTHMWSIPCPAWSQHWTHTRPQM